MSSLVAIMEKLQDHSVTSSVPELYNRHPFPPERKCIRLLHIKTGPVKATEDSLVDSQLQVIDLDDPNVPSYTALTYVCGSDEYTEHIMCEGVKIPVSKNCYSAIWHIWRKKRAPFMIWIDAVCINQRENHEKLQQISLMGEIYVQATRVYVWLGESSDATDRAMAYFEAFPFTEKYVDRNGRLNLQLWKIIFRFYFARWGWSTFPFPLVNERKKPY